MKLNKQDVADLIEAIDYAKAELCTGPEFPEERDFNDRLESLKLRFSEQLATAIEDESHFPGLPHHQP